jgi:hypothetical protein
VPEERGLQDRVQDAVVVEPGGSGRGQVGAGERPRSFGGDDGEASQRPDEWVGMTVGDGSRVDYDRARQGVVSEGGTQKLCVSSRSIEALVQA